MQREAVGAASLNLALQEVLNPAGERVSQERFCFPQWRYGHADKNNYDKEVFNGDIGTAQSVNIQDRSLFINFDGKLVEYDVTELDELLNACVTTIHIRHRVRNIRSW